MLTLKIGVEKAQPAQPFSKNVILTIGGLYAVASMILWQAVGLWAAVRTLSGGLVIVAVLWLAHRRFGDLPVHPQPVRWPHLELALALVGLGALVFITALAYRAVGWAQTVSRFDTLLLPLAFFALTGYGWRAFGLRWPSRRVWGVLALVILVKFAVAVALGRLLPEGEYTGSQGYDMGAQLSQSSPWEILLFIGRFLLFVALGEELYFRVFLQPRLQAFLPVGWAILIQAILFSAAHLPQQLISLGNPWPLALAFTVLVPDNGLLGGYLWHRTRSLPLLIVLHTFGYVTWGL